jgi:hypothetical protein
MIYKNKMPVVVDRESKKHHKVHDDGALLPLFQKSITGGMDSFFTIPINPAAPTNLIGSGKQLFFDLERDECGEINDMCIEFEISCTSADVQLVPTPYLFERIVIESAKSSGDVLKTIWPEEFFIWNQISYDEEARKRWARLSNWGIVKLNQDGESEKINVNEQTKFRAGTTKKIYLQLPALFLHLDAIDMKQIRSDLRIRFEMSTDVAVSGSASNLSVDNVQLIVRSFAEESYDNAKRQMRQKKNKHKYLYNDCERLQISDRTLNASTTVKLALDSFVGKSGMLAVFIKPSTNPSASDKSLFDYQNVGLNTTFDITNSAGQSLLGNGTPLTEEYLNTLFCSHTGNPHLDGVYIIPFCEDLKKNQLAVMQGVFDFVSVHDYLEISFGAAPTQEIHQITTAELGITGHYRLAFDSGIMDTSELEIDATETEVQNALAAIPKCAELNLSVSLDNAVDTSTTQNYTFSANSGKVSEELGKLTYLGHNGFPKVSSTAISTYGKKGWTSSANYQITILMYKFKQLCIDTKGNITCKNL